MTTLSNVPRSAPAIRHRRALSAAAATGLVGTVLDPPSTRVPAVHTRAHYVAHGCFITPHTWNDAVAEALPVCFTLVP